MTTMHDFRMWVAVVAEVRPNEFITKWMIAGLQLCRSNRFPSLDETERAAKAVAAQSALARTNNDVTAAAKLVKTSRQEFKAALKGFELEDPPSLWGTQPLGTFDDTAFPFIRTRWDTNPTESFIADYRDWMLETIVPRAINEHKKLIVLDDCSAWTDSAPAEDSTGARSLLEELHLSIREHILSTITFLPDMKWEGWTADPSNPYVEAVFYDRLTRYSTT